MIKPKVIDHIVLRADRYHQLGAAGNNVDPICLQIESFAESELTGEHIDNNVASLWPNSCRSSLP